MPLIFNCAEGNRASSLPQSRMVEAQLFARLLKVPNDTNPFAMQGRGEIGVSSRSCGGANYVHDTTKVGDRKVYPGPGHLL